MLTRLGVGYVQFLCRPGRASPLRTVIAIAERMPEIGRRFYESGPAVGIAKLEAYLRAQVAAGVLVIEDCEVAAAQFMDACLATVFKPMLFNFGAHQRRSGSSTWWGSRCAPSWPPTGGLSLLHLSRAQRSTS